MVNTSERISVVNRLLPTYRWDDFDEKDNPKISESETSLRSHTNALLLNFMRSELNEGREVLPPKNVILPIVQMNVAKRTTATRNAEALIELGDMTPPPVSMIPTFMACGHPLIGVEDRYMHNDHPSQELFAYNRLGKKSWLNTRFGEHCLKAVEFAHPHGTVERLDVPTRVKAHSPSSDSDGGKKQQNWVVVSSKSPIALINENDRQAALISRVTGAVDLTNPNLTPEETESIRELSEHETHHGFESVNILGKKALLLDALQRSDGDVKTPFYPVIQTVYLTQLR